MFRVYCFCIAAIFAAVLLTFGSQGRIQRLRMRHVSHGGSINSLKRQFHDPQTKITLLDLQKVAKSPCQTKVFKYPPTNDQAVCTDPALYFHFTGAGFGSNIMFLVNSMIYAIRNNMSFLIYPDNPPFEKHWASGFQVSRSPECPSVRKTDVHVGGKGVENKIFSETNLANEKLGRSNTRDYLGLDYTINRLEMRRCLLDGVWKLTPEMETTLFQMLQKVPIQTPYVGFHVRRGDGGKLVKSRNQYHIANYTNAIKDLEFGKDFKGVFVASDDFGAVAELQSLKPYWQIFFCPNSSRTGHISGEIKHLTTHEEYVKFSATFLCDIYGLGLADYFVGAVESGFARVVQLRRHHGLNATRLAETASFRYWDSGR